MLFLFRELYDPAIHLTNKEYLAKYHIPLDVQSKIETPHLYMLAVSGSEDGSEDAADVVYPCKERVRTLSTPLKTSEGISIDDQMRLMNGDNPSVEQEDGTQHGGHGMFWMFWSHWRKVIGGKEEACTRRDFCSKRK
jgi:hypothetical protein